MLISRAFKLLRMLADPFVALVISNMGLGDVWFVSSGFSPSDEHTISGITGTVDDLSQPCL